MELHTIGYTLCVDETTKRDPPLQEAIDEFWDLLAALPMATQPDRMSQLRDLRALILRYPAEARKIITAVDPPDP
jgi:hypothetical protein